MFRPANPSINGDALKWPSTRSLGKFGAVRSISLGSHHEVTMYSPETQALRSGRLTCPFNCPFFLHVQSLPLDQRMV